MNQSINQWMNLLSYLVLKRFGFWRDRLCWLQGRPEDAAGLRSETTLSADDRWKSPCVFRTVGRWRHRRNCDLRPKIPQRMPTRLPSARNQLPPIQWTTANLYGLAQIISRSESFKVNTEKMKCYVQCKCKPPYSCPSKDTWKFNCSIAFTLRHRILEVIAYATLIFTSNNTWKLVEKLLLECKMVSCFLRYLCHQIWSKTGFSSISFSVCSLPGWSSHCPLSYS